MSKKRNKRIKDAPEEPEDDPWTDEQIDQLFGIVGTAKIKKQFAERDGLEPNAYDNIPDEEFKNRIKLSVKNKYAKEAEEKLQAEALVEQGPEAVAKALGVDPVEFAAFLKSEAKNKSQE